MGKGLLIESPDPARKTCSLPSQSQSGGCNPPRWFSAFALGALAFTLPCLWHKMKFCFSDTVFPNAPPAARPEFPGRI